MCTALANECVPCTWMGLLPDGDAEAECAGGCSMPWCDVTPVTVGRFARRDMEARGIAVAAVACAGSLPVSVSGLAGASAAA